MRVITQIAAQKVLTWESILHRFEALPWAIGEAPWLAVFNPENSKMITSKENTKLLDDLLYVHLAASSKQSIVKSRKQFRDVRGFAYPVSESQLQANLTPHTENRAPALPDLVPTPEGGDSQPESEETSEVEVG